MSTYKLTADTDMRKRQQEIANDDKILWGVVANAKPTRNKARVIQVMKATGNGLTVCTLLCKRFGFDPYEVKK